MVRVSHLSKLCRDCFVQKVGEVYRDYQGVSELTCPNCGISTEDDRDTVWGTAFPAGFNQIDMEVPFCGACAAIFRTWVLSASQPLDQVRGLDSGPSPTRPSATDVLRDLGWQPRAS